MKSGKLEIVLHHCLVVLKISKFFLVGECYFFFLADQRCIVSGQVHFQFEVFEPSLLKHLQQKNSFVTSVLIVITYEQL